MSHDTNGSEKRGGSSAGIAFILSVVWLTALAGVGLSLIATAGASETKLTAGVMLVAVACAVLPITLIGAWAIRGQARGLDRALMELARALSSMTQEAGLSEGAKRVLHRRQERELLRRAIEQDIQDEDWDAAMVLVKELAERFGYRADAEEFRTRIERARLQTLDRQVVDALGALDDLIRANNWTESYAEAARIQRLFPESHRVDGLRERVDESRQRYRRELERKFLVAAQREQLDEAMSLLKELDQYLTPGEAAPLEEVARGVVVKSRENLGVRFKLMVQDHQWSEALEAGERLVSEFPNSRMADEVRGLLPVLRERAASLNT